MDTPIKDFIDRYNASGAIRGHMPGHKGRGDFFNSFDITEISGADSLFEADGIIRQSEENASSLFGTYKTIYSAAGSTLCIQTMLMMCIEATGSRKIAAVRNCHRAFLSAAALLDLDVRWIYPEYKDSFVSGAVSGEAVERALAESGAGCLYITSPDYLGRIADLDEISGICRKYNALLIVDNAHGAYLRFITDEDGVPAHPIYHGADICCDSAHKTLPVLTGGAYLHIMNEKLEKYDGYAKQVMSVFGSSSPSYLILRSLDMCNDYMENYAWEDFRRMLSASVEIKEKLSCAWQIEDGEYGKLSVYAPAAGMYGYELAERLREYGIECEHSDNTHAIIMLTGLDTEEIYSIADAFERIRQPKMIIKPPELSGLTGLERAMSIREAAFAPSEEIDAELACGRICARAVSCCPPGIAVVVGGEIFSPESINILKNYSIFKVNVVK